MQCFIVYVASELNFYTSRFDPSPFILIHRFLNQTSSAIVIITSVADPHHMLIRILLFTLMTIRIQLFHFDADPDPDPNLRPDLHALHGSILNLHGFRVLVLTLKRIRIQYQLFTLMQIRIRLSKMARIHADPDSAKLIITNLNIN